jgi:hypothetical protein
MPRQNSDIANQTIQRQQAVRDEIMKAGPPPLSCRPRPARNTSQFPK